MGRRKSESVDGCLALLVFPLAFLCAFPILFIPVIIIIVLIITVDVIQISEKIQLRKQQKKQEEAWDKLIASKTAAKEDNVVEVEINDQLTFEDILSICDDIEDKLLEVEVDYNDLNETNEEVDSLYFDLEEYDSIVNEYRNKKLVDLNEDLLSEISDVYDKFINLYNEFYVAINEEDVDLVDDVDDEEDINIKDAVVAGALGYGLYKRHKEEQEEKEREEYREELRNVWGLTEYQIGLVESGEYEPCQFSEEEIEEDDYYSEDDNDF